MAQFSLGHMYVNGQGLLQGYVRAHMRLNLGAAHLPLLSHLNGELLGRPNAGAGMTFDFPTLMAHAAKTRALGPGTIIGSGTVSNRDRALGSSCIAERRIIEMLEQGEARTPFLHFGDVVRIEMLDADGVSIFGAIEQRVARGHPGR